MKNTNFFKDFKIKYSKSIINEYGEDENEIIISDIIQLDKDFKKQKNKMTKDFYFKNGYKILFYIYMIDENFNEKKILLHNIESQKINNEKIAIKLENTFSSDFICRYNSKILCEEGDCYGKDLSNLSKIRCTNEIKKIQFLIRTKTSNNDDTFYDLEVDKNYSKTNYYVQDYKTGILMAFSF